MMISLNNHITATPDLLVEDSVDHASVFLREAVKKIDTVFGKGYAKKNPNLVAAFMQCAVTELTAAVRAQQHRLAIEEAVENTIQYRIEYE